MCPPTFAPAPAWRLRREAIRTGAPQRACFARPLSRFPQTSLGGQMTLYHRSLLADHGQRRRAAAVLDSDAAARMEAATWRNVGGIGQRLAEADVRHAETRLRRQHACQQRLRIRVAWRPKQSVGLVALDEAAEIHDRDLARHVFDHGEVMADE